MKLKSSLLATLTQTIRMAELISKVNASPSLAADTPVDHELKYGMLDDVLTLVDMEHKLPPQSLTQVQSKTLLVFIVCSSHVSILSNCFEQLKLKTYGWCETGIP